MLHWNLGTKIYTFNFTWNIYCGGGAPLRICDSAFPWIGSIIGLSNTSHFFKIIFYQRYTSKTPFIGCLLNLRDLRETQMRNYTKQWELARIFEKYLNAGYSRTFIYSVINVFDIKVGKDRIFKKYLNASCPRTFTSA